MEDHAEHPACQSKVSKSHIIFPERVAHGYPFAYLVQAMLMRQEVKERKQDREGFLDAYESVEGPFAVILDNRLEHRRIPQDSPIRDDMLADIVAIGSAGPKEESEMEGWSGSQSTSPMPDEVGVDLRTTEFPYPQFSSIQT